MAMVEMAAVRRRDSGKEVNRKRIAQGVVPGVIYGKGVETRSLSFNRKELEKFLAAARTGTVVVKMKVDDGGTATESCAVLKEVQSNPLTDSVVHVDFYEVALGRKFRIDVPLRVRGKAAGAELGGILELVFRTIEVECTPDNVPEFIEVDVSALGLGQALHLSDLTFPKDVVPVEKDMKITIAACQAPKAEVVKEAVPEEGAEVAEGASVAEAPEKGKEKEKEKE